jgi:Zn-finger nucleic acid-binding protein
MLAPPKCAQCGAELKLGASGQLDAWTCPAGHGVGFTLSEAYGRIQDDELSKIWHDSEQGSPGKHACPMCAVPMVNVSVAVDADESADGEPGDQPDSAQVSLEVCREDQFIWFDPGDLDAFPQDLRNAEPSAEELGQIARIRKDFDQSIDETYADHGLLSRFADRVASRHPGFTRFLDHAVYGNALDESDAA